MKVYFALLIIITASLLLFSTSCQQTKKGESKTHWQLRPPPRTAAGYGNPPLVTNDTHDTSSVPHAGENVQQEKTPTRTESTDLQSATQKDVTSSSVPSIKIEPPPSAAGYGSPPLDAEDRKETSSVTPVGDNGHSKTNSTMHKSTSEEPKHLQPTSGGYGTGPFTPTWTIEPPPSAAGYGK